MNQTTQTRLKKGTTDEWYTPSEAIYPLLKHIPNNIKTIWCPFDNRKSLFVKILKAEGYKVINSHIDYKKDFFEYEPKTWDMIISNPPYSVRNDILKRVFTFNKPFALLMNTNGLFDSAIRWSIFNSNDFSLLYVKGRVNYMRKYGLKEKGSPPFQSAYICSKVSNEKIILMEGI